MIKSEYKVSVIRSPASDELMIRITRTREDKLNHSTKLSTIIDIQRFYVHPTVIGKNAEGFETLLTQILNNLEI